MATVHYSNRSLTRMLVGNTPAAPPDQDVCSWSPSLARDLGHLGRILLGVLLLLLGGAMVLTLWLLPIGLPLALLGVALVFAGESA